MQSDATEEEQGKDVDHLIAVLGLWVQRFQPYANKRLGSFVGLQTEVHGEHTVRFTVEAAGSQHILVPAVQVEPHITVSELKVIINDALPQRFKSSYFHLYPDQESREPLQDSWTLERARLNDGDSLVLVRGACTRVL